MGCSLLPKWPVYRGAQFMAEFKLCISREINYPESKSAIPMMQFSLPPLPLPPLSLEAMQCFVKNSGKYF